MTGIWSTKPGISLVFMFDNGGSGEKSKWQWLQRL